MPDDDLATATLPYRSEQGIFGIRYPAGIRILKWAITPPCLQMATRDWPASGEGIFYAMVTGELAARAILSDASMDDPRRGTTAGRAARARARRTTPAPSPSGRSTPPSSSRPSPAAGRPRATGAPTRASSSWPTPCVRAPQIGSSTWTISVSPMSSSTLARPRFRSANPRGDTSRASTTRASRSVGFGGHSLVKREWPLCLGVGTGIPPLAVPGSAGALFVDKACERFLYCFDLAYPSWTKGLRGYGPRKETPCANAPLWG